MTETAICPELVTPVTRARDRAHCARHGFGTSLRFRRQRPGRKPVIVSLFATVDCINSHEPNDSALAAAVSPAIRCSKHLAQRERCDLKSRAVLFLIMVLLLASCQQVFAQKSGNTGPKYDVTKQVKIKGVIEDIHETSGTYEGTHLLVKTDTGTVLVQVAPAAFLKDIDASFNKGEEIQVVGAQNVGTEGEEVLAKEITVGNNTTTLRDDSGVPVWAGWKAPKK